MQTTPQEFYGLKLSIEELIFFICESSAIDTSNLAII
jgi:hypothetical protein